MSSTRPSLWSRLMLILFPIRPEERLPPDIENRIAPRGSLMQTQPYR